MPDWLHSIDVSADYALAEDTEITPQEFAKRALPKLQEIPAGMKDERINSLIEELESFSENEDADADDFDDIWHRVYDWADSKRVWINTILMG